MGKIYKESWGQVLICGVSMVYVKLGHKMSKIGHII